MNEGIHLSCDIVCTHASVGVRSGNNNACIVWWCGLSILSTKLLSFFSFSKLLSFCCLWTGLYIVAGYAEEIMVCCSFSWGIHIYKHGAYSLWMKWTFFPQMPSFHNLLSDKAPHYCSFLNFIVWEWNTVWWLWDIYLFYHWYMWHTLNFVCVCCVFVTLCAYVVKDTVCCLGRPANTMHGFLCFVCEGLCGTYDDNRDNDLQQKDGQVYEGRGLRPDPFSLSWR